MNFLDWCLVLLVVLYALSGYWQGFVAGAFATVGLVAGGLIGIWLVPILLGGAAPSMWVSLGALFIVLIAASVGQALFQYAGTRARDRIPWQPVRSLDAVGGSVLSVVAVLVISWMLGVAISGSRIPGLSPMVRGSKVLLAVNEVMPAGAQSALRGFDDVVGSSVFPRYLEPFAPEHIVAVPPASRRVVRDPDIQRAERSVFKIRGDNACGQGVEGSGFLYAPHRMLTNAHVVAGVRHPAVLVGTDNVVATVVYYDPETDVAILSVPSLSGPVLSFDRDGRTREAGAILGYPEDGPFQADPARIRSQQRLRSPDIYGHGTVTRDVFSVRGKIRPGNSGGPLVSTDGKVLGVVFAASVSSSDTGYALTADQVGKAAAAGIDDDRAVSTGGCA
ncbi:MAG TPA: MarP family serine protease [Marmoricola sp.]